MTTDPAPSGWGIPGTSVFAGTRSRAGYYLNKLATLARSANVALFALTRLPTRPAAPPPRPRRMRSRAGTGCR